MTTLPQTTAIRLPRPAGQMQLASANGGTPMMGSAGGGSAAMSGGDVWRVIRTNIWLILFMLVFSGGAGWGVNEFLGKKYPHFTTAGYIGVQPNTIDPLIRKSNDQGGDPAVVTLEQKTQAALLRSDTLLTQVLLNDSSETRKTTWFKKFNNNIPAAVIT